jgi:hypothetical protein
MHGNFWCNQMQLRRPDDEPPKCKKPLFYRYKFDVCSNQIKTSKPIIFSLLNGPI